MRRRRRAGRSQACRQQTAKVLHWCVTCVCRHLPDKALDLVDEAAARVRVDMSLKPEVSDACAVCCREEKVAYKHTRTQFHTDTMASVLFASTSVYDAW